MDLLSLLRCTGELRTHSLSYLLLSIMFPFHVPICITTWVALQGDEHRASLIVTVNDMGNYGCYPGCTDLMSMPHFVEVSVSLMREKPLSSLFAHVFGSAIIVEFILVLSFGVILLFFICKCAFVLINEKRRQASQDFEFSNVQNSQEGTLTKDLSDKMTRVRGCCSNFFTSNLQLSKFHLRSCLQLGIGGFPKATNTSSSDQLEMTSPSGISAATSAKDEQLEELPSSLLRWSTSFS